MVGGFRWGLNSIVLSIASRLLFVQMLRVIFSCVFMARNAEKIAEIDKYLYFLSKDFFQSKSRNAFFQRLFEIFEGNITNVIEFMASYSVSVTQREKKTGKIFFNLFWISIFGNSCQTFLLLVQLNYLYVTMTSRLWENACLM